MPRQPVPDTPEQIEELLALGAERSMEFNGIGHWKIPGSAKNWGGAQNALAAIKGEPIPWPHNPMFPGMGG